MTFQLLVAALNADVDELITKMNIDSDAVLINQCDSDDTYVVERGSHTIQVISRNERGVGLSRNTALSYSSADIVLFSDEDIVYEKGYEEKVRKAFEAHPDCSVITLNVVVDPKRKTYWNETAHPVNWKNYGRYPAYAIAARRRDIISKDIAYSTLFGGGAKYSNGEDSLFLHDCLEAGLKIYAETQVIGEETYRESTWFKGYTEKYFIDRGVLYHFLYKKAASLLGLRFLIKTHKDYSKEMTFLRAYALLKKGIREGKSL